MAEQSRRSKGTHMVGFNYRRCPACLEAKKLIEEGAIGEILSFRALYLQDSAMPDGTPWSSRSACGGGGVRRARRYRLARARLRAFPGGRNRKRVRRREDHCHSASARWRSELCRRIKGQRGRQASPWLERNDPVDVDDVAVSLIRFTNGALGTGRPAASPGNTRTIFPSRSAAAKACSPSDGSAATNFITILQPIETTSRAIASSYAGLRSRAGSCFADPGESARPITKLRSCRREPS